MITATAYAEIMGEIKSCTNKEYLHLQIVQLGQMFYREPSAIKNINLEYLAFSNGFASEFGLSYTSLGKKLEELSSQNQEIISETINREQSIIKNKSQEISLLFARTNQQNICFLMRKFPLINPATQDVVGILIFAKRIDMLFLRKIVTEKFLNRKIQQSSVIKKEFTEKQMLIISCLLLGFHQRKEIAMILDKHVENGLNDIQIRNNLQTLYDRYKCSSSAKLIELISVDNDANFDIPAKLIPENITILKG